MKNQNKKLSVRYQVKSFKWAFNGLRIFFSQEVKARIHVFAAVLAITAGTILQLNILEWLGITIAIALVFITEIINTAIEEITDTLPDSLDSTRGKVKDISAGAVLFASFTAVIIALLIFTPKIIALWNL